jgi:hypothetical protein
MVRVSAIGIDPTHPQLMLVSTRRGISRSSDGGGDYISGFGINPADPDHVIVTDWMQCCITRDRGQTWMTAHTRSAEPPGRRGKGMRWINTGLVVTTVWNYYLDFLRISRAAPVGFKYWEIGNGVYGSWETDSNSPPHDPYTYTLRARDYISLIKGVDPTVKTGVVVTPGEDAYSNYTNPPVVNPRTQQTHNGWTPVLLATLASLGVTPDFAIHHRYPEGPGAETDAGLLASSTGWASDAANLRQQITDYFGPGGTNIELVCTENNSVSSNPGKQSTSLVNGLFMADNLV